MEERKLSWNKEYYYEDGAWWWVDGEWKDEEVDHLPSISCGKCRYSGEEDAGNYDGDSDCGIEHIWIKEKKHTTTEIYRCNNCNQLYIDHIDKEGLRSGWWSELNGSNIGYVLFDWE